MRFHNKIKFGPSKEMMDFLIPIDQMNIGLGTLHLELMLNHTLEELQVNCLHLHN